MRALIVEPGATRGALGAARALDAAGWKVGVGIPRRRGALAAASRATDAVHPVPRPGEDPEAFVAAINAAIAARGYEIVFGGGDAELLAISAHRSRIDAAVPHSPHRRVVRALDKLELVERGREAGLAVPATAEATGPAIESFEYPALVKSRLHAPADGGAGTARLEAVGVADPATAAAAAAAMSEAGGAPLLQESVAGRLLAYAVVIDERGEVAAASAQLAEGTWPPGIGISARAATIARDPVIEHRIAELCRALGWTGLAQVQLIAGDDGTAPRLIDLNGRFYGSIALAVGAGANLPAVWAAIATGREPPSERFARPGVRFQWFAGDLHRLGAERGRAAALAAALAHAPGAVHATWRLGDPMPALSRMRSRLGAGS